MKPKLLLAGHNATIIDDFFYAMNEEFECLTTSNRNGDIVNHISYFQPDAFVYCFASETKEDMLKLSIELDKITRKQQKMILIGYPEVCDEFLRLNQEIVKLVIHRPASATTIKTKLLKYFKELSEEAAIEAEKAAKEAEEAAKQSEAASTEISTPDTISLTTADSEQKRILVIDDDTLMLSLIKKELKEHYNVATAISGKVGMKFLERKNTDLILLDYEMPEEDGAAVFAKLRANPKTSNIPVVFLTGINDREKIQKVLAMKPQGYLLKPIECEQLVKVIEQIIG